MDHELLTPPRRLARYELPSYVKLDMAFGIGAGAKLMDKSRYRSHGTLTTPTWADGLHGRCLDFVKASSDRVVIPAAYDQLDFTSEDFSIVMRVYSHDVSVEQCLFARGAFNTAGYYTMITAAGAVEINICQEDARQLNNTAAGAISNNTWYTVGFTRAGTASYVLIDGVNETVSSAPVLDPLTYPSAAYLGIYTTLFHYKFDGLIEFCRVFGGVALSESAHLAWHNALK